MNGFQFHAEMPTARKSKAASKSHPFQPWTRATLKRYATDGRKINVCAIYSDRAMSFISSGEVMREGIIPVFDYENSAVCGGSAAQAYLNSRTTRIDEATARKLHPALFAYLD
jgi:hypothetical protein